MPREVTPTRAWERDSARPRGIRSPNPAMSGTMTIAGSSIATDAAPTATAPPFAYATSTTAIQVANSMRSQSRYARSTRRIRPSPGMRRRSETCGTCISTSAWGGPSSIRVASDSVRTAWGPLPGRLRGESHG